MWAWFCSSVHPCVRLCAHGKPLASDRPLKGFNYPALFLAWDTILSPDKAERRQGLWSHCEQLFSLSLTNGRQGHTCWGPLHFYFLQQNVLYDPKCAHKKTYLILSFFSLCLSCTLFLIAFVFHFTLVQHKTLCSYYRVSRARKSLWGLPRQLQAQPRAPYLGLCALNVSLGSQRHGVGRLEG